MINDKMTMGEMFGVMVTSRGISGCSPTVDIIAALVDTMREASESVSETASNIIEDFLDGNGSDYEDVLTDTVGEYISNRTGEVMSVPLLPHYS